MSTMKLLMPGANTVHIILLAQINHSNLDMLSKSKYQLNIGLEKDSQSSLDGEKLKVHLSNFGMPTFSTSTEKRMVSMSWFIPDHTMPSGTDMKFMNLLLQISVLAEDFYIIWYFVTIETMSITDTEQMETLMATHIWSQSVSILINFVRIAWLVATRGCESKLSDWVEPLSTDLVYWFITYLLEWGQITLCILVQVQRCRLARGFSIASIVVIVEVDGC